MTKFFEQFPLVNYNLSGVNGNTIQVTDIFRKVKVRSKIAKNVALFDIIDIPEGDNPEDIAYKAYGDADYFWVVCLMNNIVNRYYDWPLDEYNFQQFVADKNTNPDGIHHYEITQTSGSQTGDGPDDYSHKLEVNSDTAGAQSVSNIEYERRLQDKIRKIRLLQPAFLDDFLEEFKLLINQ